MTIEGEDTAVPASPPLSAAELSVALDFFLASRTVPIADVAAWREGGVVALPGTGLEAGVPVTIRNGDAVVAEGHLVMLDDCCGVRITKTFISA